MKQGLKKVTAFKWYLNMNGNSTGKEYTVLFDSEVGVQTILSVCAVEMKDHQIINSIDITEAEVKGADLDAFIDQMFDWDSLQAEQHESAPKRDQFFHMAASIVKKHAVSYRH